MGIKMKYIYLVLLICTFTNIFAQSRVRQGTERNYDAFLLPQGFGIRLLNSRGASGTFNDVSNISLVSPASLHKHKNYSFGISYQFQTNINNAWILDIGTSRIQNYLPQSLGGVIHYDNFSLGIGMGQKYNGSIDFDPIPITTVNNPDGTGEYYIPEFENTLQIYTFSAAYLVKEVFSKNSNLSLGLRYILNKFYRYERIYRISAETDILGSSFEFGANYELNLDDNKYLGIGISYVPSAELNDELEYNNSDTIVIPDVNRTTIQANLPQYIIVLKLPSELSLDLSLKLNDNLLLLGRGSYLFWNDISNNIENQLELSSSAAYSFNPSLNASIGFYYTGREYIEDFFNLSEELYALYLTAGLSILFSSFQIDLALADSHLFSGELWKQTIGKIGLGIHL